MTADKLKAEARYYDGKPWRALEFEERAFVRRLMREGFARIDSQRVVRATEAARC